MKRLLPFVACFLLISPAQGQSANDLFQQALVMERSEGDLLDANSLYERVIEAGTDRALSAKALIRIGENYERLGLRLARQAYQRVLDDYSEQEETARIARDRLAILLDTMAEWDPKTIDSGVFKTQVLDIPDNMGEVSPDGRYLSFVEWNSANVGYIDLETGEQTLVNSDGFWGSNSSAFGDVSIWSPDGKELMYLWLSQKGPEEEGEIRIFNMETGETRVLVPAGSDDVPFPIALFDDGDKLLAINERRGHVTDAITVVDTETARTRVVKTLSENRHTFEMDISRDKKYIVYESFETGQRKNLKAPSNIDILSVDGESVHAIAENGMRNYDPVFDATGQHVLYLTSHDDTTELWAQDVTNGRVSGEPRLVYNGFGGHVDAEGISDDGRYFYSILDADVNVYAQGVNFSTGELNQNLRVVSSASYGQQRSGAISPNGELLAFITENRRSGVSDLIVTHLETGETKVHELPFGPLQIPRAQPLVWSSDNSSVLLQTDKSSKPVLVSVDLNESSFVEMVGFGEFQVESTQDLRGEGYSADGNRIFFATPNRLVETGLGGRTQRIIAEFEDQEIRSMSLSPDAKTAALILGGGRSRVDAHPTIVLVRIEDGKVSERDVNKTTMAYSRYVGICWTPDGKGLVFAENRPKSGQQLYHLDLQTGQRTALGDEVFDTDQFLGVTVHPDGDKLTFWKASKESSQLWVLDGIDL